ncbi:hypothetical protein L596_009957 [Steinernema carpocapsae]|uniref:Uncharacterized protein n=1 Tax=Steinernema carpocapsae TaxID=34508 RepID=A0A4U5PHD0_STECR|nr:hypothetical protein L596_009957 [Steinernema carpocapsae]
MNCLSSAWFSQLFAKLSFVMESNDLHPNLAAQPEAPKNGPTIEILKYTKHVFGLSSLAYLVICILIGINMGPLFILPLLGFFLYSQMFPHFYGYKLEIYKFYPVGNFAIFQGVLSIMFFITGFAGFIVTFSSYHTSEGVTVALLAWVSSCIYGLFTLYFWMYYEFLRSEDKKKQPILGNNARLDDLSFTNPYKAITLPNGYVLDVPRLIKVVFLGNLANFITVITVFFISVRHRYAWIGTIPLVFALHYYVLFAISNVERFAKHRKLFISAFTEFSALFGLVFGFSGFVFIVIIFTDGAIYILLALGAILSSAVFLFTSYFNYSYVMYLTFQESCGTRFFQNNLREAAKNENRGFANIHGQHEKHISNLI